MTALILGIYNNYKNKGDTYAIFIQTTRFYPEGFEKLGFLKKDDGFYIYTKDNSLWKEKPLLDLGYGKENGLVKIFDLSFNDLVKLVLIDYRGIIYEETYNSWGALSVLTDDYSLEFLNYLTKKYDKNGLKSNHKFIYDYLNAEFNLNDNFLKKISNKQNIECCNKWKEFINKI